MPWIYSDPQLGWHTTARLLRPEISAIATGRLVPSTVTALALAAAFNCQVEHLFRRAIPRPTWLIGPGPPS